MEVSGKFEIILFQNRVQPAFCRKFLSLRSFLTGWYFGKTAGLWGTINNEASDDFLTPSKKIMHQSGHFAQTWSLGKSCHSVSNQAVFLEEPDHAIFDLCDSLFDNKLSSFQVCYQNVEPEQFMKMCLNSKNENEICSVATAYVEACLAENTPIRIPDACIKYVHCLYNS